MNPRAVVAVSPVRQGMALEQIGHVFGRMSLKSRWYMRCIQWRRQPPWVHEQ